MNQLARADVMFASPSWSPHSNKVVKILQFRNKIRIIKIPALGLSSICRVAALKAIKLYPGSPNSTLFQIKCYGHWVPLTDTRL